MKDTRLTIIIDKDLHYELKTKALKQKKTMTEVITELLTKWVVK